MNEKELLLHLYNNEVGGMVCCHKDIDKKTRVATERLVKKDFIIRDVDNRKIFINKKGIEKIESNTWVKKLKSMSIQNKISIIGIILAILTILFGEIM